MKIKVSWLWIPFLCMGISLGMLKTMVFLFFMLSIHEAAHIVLAYLFHYPIESITFYPFGVCAKMRYIGMGNIFQEVCIVLAGPCTHVCFPFVFMLLVRFGIISQSYYEYLLLLNQSILVFNILPVFPLDGGRIMQSLYHLVFRYTTAQRLTFLTSIINLFLLFYYGILQTWSAYFVMFFLFLQIVYAWRQIAIERLQFYHYRKTHPVSYKIRMNTSHDLYRANTNVLKEKDGWMLEDVWLHHYFHEDKQAHEPAIFL